MIEITRNYARYILALENTSCSEGFLASNESSLENSALQLIGVELIEKIAKEFPDVANNYKYMFKEMKYEL